MTLSRFTQLPPYTTFLYPQSHELPFDEICDKIVRMLESRNWKISGLDLIFCDSGTGEEKFRFVRKIKRDGFSLTFRRKERRINKEENLMAPLEKIKFPGLKQYIDRSNELSIPNGIAEQIVEWLQEEIVQKIELSEDVAQAELTSEPEIPYPEHLGPLYLKIDRESYLRIIQGKEDKKALAPWNRYALLGGGPRVVALTVLNDGSLPPEAYDGYRQCSLTRPKLYKNVTEAAILAITPKNANHIYVADFPRKGGAVVEEEYQKEVAQTLKPINEYKGGYDDPLFLIGSAQEISFDEVEVVATQDPEMQEENIV